MDDSDEFSATAEVSSVTTPHATVTGVAQIIEIVPLDILRHDSTTKDDKGEFGLVQEVADEFSVDVKQEPEDLSQQHIASPVKVRLYLWTTGCYLQCDADITRY